MSLEIALESFIAVQAGMNRQLTKVIENWAEQSNMINPQDAYMGPDGEPWIPLSGGGVNQQSQVYRNDGDLDRVRGLTRWLAAENTFAKNSHSNRINYIVGWGHTYTVMEKPDVDISDDDLQSVRDVVDEFLKVNLWSPSYITGEHQVSGRMNWGFRQHQNVTRQDRDGEAIIRKFRHEDGILRLRYIESYAMRNPSHTVSGNIKYGIETDPDDEETILRYWVNDIPIEASEIQHRTRDGSPDHPRGVPIHYTCRKNLVRADKLLRNGSTVTEVQTAIGMIRKHAQATKTAVAAFQAGLTTDRNASNDEPRRQQYKPGTILDANQGTEYEFPGMGIDPSKYIASLSAELRAIAASLVMPEFMLTSDASNSNFASTMVAEGPASKNFENLQWHEIAYDVSLIWDALKYAAESRRISPAVLDLIEIQSEAPIAQARNRLEESQVAQNLSGLGLLSPQTGSAQFSLSYEQEQANIDTHNERNGLPISGDRPDLPPIPGEDDDDVDGDVDDDEQDDD